MLNGINTTIQKHTYAVTVGLAVMVIVPFVMFTDAGDSLFDSRPNASDRVIGQVDGQDIKAVDAKDYESAIKLTVALEYNQAVRTIPESALLNRMALLEKIDAEAKIASVTQEDIKNYLLNETQIKAIQSSVQLDNLNDTLKFLRNRYLNLGGAEFDQIIKENALIKKHETSIKDAVVVSDEDAKKAFVKDNTKYTFKSRDYSALTFADAEIKKAYEGDDKDLEKAETRQKVLEKLYGTEVQAYFDENKARFNTQKQFSATAVQFNSAQFLSQIDEATITDKMIQSAYDQQSLKYGQKQVKLITLSAPLEKNVTAKKKVELKQELRKALAEIKKSNGADYQKNEAKYTEKGLTTTKSTWTNETALDESFTKLVEKTAKGQSSEITEETEQLVAVYILDKRDNTPIEEATTAIKADIKNQLATAKAFEAATKFQQALPNGSDLKALTLKTVELAEKASATVKALPKGSGQNFFQNLMQASILPKLSSMQAYQAFFSETNNLSPEKATTSPIETQSGVAILVLKEFEASRPQTLEEVRERVLDLLSTKKGTELAQAAAVKDLEAYATVKEFSKNPDKAQFTDKAAKAFSALSSNDKKAAEKAEAPGLYHLEKTTTGAEILFVATITKPTDKEIEEGYKTSLETLKSEAQQKALTDFYTELNESVQIVKEEVATK